MPRGTSDYTVRTFKLNKKISLPNWGRENAGSNRRCENKNGEVHAARALHICIMKRIRVGVNVRMKRLGCRRSQYQTDNARGSLCLCSPTSALEKKLMLSHLGEELINPSRRTATDLYPCASGSANHTRHGRKTYSPMAASFIYSIIYSIYYIVRTIWLASLAQA
jgi:hypothetical protein